MTTKPTLGANKSVGNTLGAAEWNLNVLQQGNWTQEVLAGTNSDKIPGTAIAGPVTLQGNVYYNNDGNAGLEFSSVNPTLKFDAGPDSFAYIRATNLFQWIVAAALIMQLDSGGKLTGAGFFASAETAITTGATATIAHGYGTVAGPRFVDGVYASGTGVRPDVPLDHHSSTLAGRGTVRLAKYEDNTGSINVTNDTGATVYVTVFAIR